MGWAAPRHLPSITPALRSRLYCTRNSNRNRVCGPGYRALRLPRAGRHPWPERQNRFSRSNADGRAKYPAIFKSLLVDRNKAWLPKPEELLRTAEVEFVLVSAGHMPGSEGLLAQLRARLHD